MDAKMKVLIIGAAGRTGRLLVEQALAQGHDVTALVRTPAKVQTRHPRLRVLQGDILNPASVDAVVAGQDAILSSLGTRQWLRPTALFSQGTGNLLKAMSRHGVRRLICITGVGVRDTRGHGPFIYENFLFPLFTKRVYEDKDRQEELIRRSDREWILVRPGLLTNGPATGKFRVLTHLRGATIGRISRADVAAFMLAQLVSSRYVRQAPVVTY
jgi:putative NADH-flavin reductase